MIRNPFRKITDSINKNLNGKIAIFEMIKYCSYPIKQEIKNIKKNTKRFFNNKLFGYMYYLLLNPIKGFISYVICFSFFAKKTENEFRDFCCFSKMNLFNAEFHPLIA